MQLYAKLKAMFFIGRLAMYNYTYDTRYCDFKDFDTIKPGTIFDAIQEVAIRHSAECGFGVDVLREMNRAWLLQGIDVRFEKTVRTHIPIEAYTAVKSMKGVVSERGCILRQNGEVVAKSISNWCLLDTEKMRLTRIPKEMAVSYESYDFGDDFFTYERPEIMEDAAEKYTIRVSNKELDTNKHLNNQKGAELLMDALPFEFELKNVRIFYPNPAYLGEKLSVCVKEIENGYYVHLKNEANAVCVAGTFEK